MDKKETGEYEEEKGTGSEAKKEIKRKFRENVGNCPFENERIYPMTSKNPKNPVIPTVFRIRSSLLISF